MALPKRRTDIEPAALREFRERRGWTLEQMADVIWASPLEVAAWEAGTIRVPGEQAGCIRAFTAWDERYAAVIAAELPTCAWADANLPGLAELLCFGPYPVNLDLPSQRHLGECGTCRSMLRSARMLKVPSPAQGPDWLVAALHLAGLLVLVVLLTQAFPELPDAVGGGDLGLALVVGFAVFRFTAGRLDRLWKRWPYPAALLAAVAGMVSGLSIWMIDDTSRELSFGLLAGCAAVALLAGAVAGWWTGWTDSGDEDDDQAPANLLPGERVPAADVHAARPDATPVSSAR
jgi:hypothetical protein